MKTGVFGSVLLLFALVNTADAQDHSEHEAAVNGRLDRLHQMASEANYDEYFALFSEEAVFMGTDATERWPIEEFKSYAKARFESGGGWTYHMKSRFIYVSEDGNTAWFDELLHNENLGLTRGTGVFVNQEGNWLISQYNLTIPVPNQLARDLAARIRALEN